MKFPLLALVALGSAPLMADDFAGFTIDFVQVPGGNAADHNGYGAVGYDYRIAKYEVSRLMIESYNSNNEGHELRLHNMASFGGNGTDRAATGMTWNHAARFVNWLNTLSGSSPAYKFTTAGSNDNIELWQPGDAGYHANNPFRNSNAKYFLPSEDEWYKSAFYDPNANGGAGGYWDYATKSDSAPTAVTNGTTGGTAVYDQVLSQGPADIDDAGGLSASDTMAQSGNVSEWVESGFSQPNDSASEPRVYRGGYWNASSSGLASEERANNLPVVYGFTLGFRIASVSLSIAAPEMTVSGRGVNINNGDDTPTVFEYTDFGPTVIGNAPLIHEFLITNVGDQDLTLAGTPLVQLTGSSAFSITVQPASPTVVAGGGRQTFTIAFDPTTSGVQTAVVSISNNDSDENPFTFTIQGDTQTAMRLFNDAVALAGLTGSDALPDAEPFNDGVPNRLKYAFNMNLAGPDNSSMPSGGVGGLPSGKLVEVDGLLHWRVEFVRRKGSGLIYESVKSSDLTPNSFVSFSALGMPEPIDLLWERVIYDEPITLTGNARFFSRVEVTLP